MRLKKFIALVIILAFTQIFCSACGYTKVDENITLCVYADSRSAAANGVASAVADAVAEYLQRESAVMNISDLHAELAKRSDSVKSIADSSLRRRGFGYGARVDCNGNTVTVILGSGNGAAVTWVYTMQDDSLYKSVIADSIRNAEFGIDG